MHSIEMCHLILKEKLPQEMCRLLVDVVFAVRFSSIGHIGVIWEEVSVQVSV